MILGKLHLGFPRIMILGKWHLGFPRILASRNSTKNDASANESSFGPKPHCTVKKKCSGADVEFRWRQSGFLVPENRPCLRVSHPELAKKRTSRDAKKTWGRALFYLNF